MEMPLTVSQLVIYFCCKDALVRVATSCDGCQIHNPADAETNTTCLEKLFLGSAVDGRSGTPLPTLVMSESIFWSDLPNFIDCILCHNVMGAITNPGIDLTLDKGMGKLYPYMTSLQLAS